MEIDKIKDLVEKYNCILAVDNIIQDLTYLFKQQHECLYKNITCNFVGKNGLYSDVLKQPVIDQIELIFTKSQKDIIQVCKNELNKLEIEI